MNTTDTSWVQVGAEVATYSDRPGAPLNLRRSTITKVNSNTFRIDGSDLLWNIRTQLSQGGSYYGERAVLVDSPEYRELRDRMRVENAQYNVDQAYNDWRRDQGNLGLASILRHAAGNLEDELIKSAQRAQEDVR